MPEIICQPGELTEIATKLLDDLFEKIENLGVIFDENSEFHIYNDNIVGVGSRLGVYLWIEPYSDPEYEEVAIEAILDIHPQNEDQYWFWVLGVINETHNQFRKRVAKQCST